MARTVVAVVTVRFAYAPGWYRLETLGEHLHGTYIRRDDGGIDIPVLNCLEPGQGHVSRFLDALPDEEDIRVLAVVSPILQGALERRGWIEGPRRVWYRR